MGGQEWGPEIAGARRSRHRPQRRLRVKPWGKHNRARKKLRNNNPESPHLITKQELHDMGAEAIEVQVLAHSRQGMPVPIITMPSQEDGKAGVKRRVLEP